MKPISIQFSATRLLLTAIHLTLFSSIAFSQSSTFYVTGSSIYAPNGEQVIFRGVNKMIFYNDRDGDPSYREIAKTGANSVRIFWFTTGTAAELDLTLANAIAQNMIPIPSLWEATGKWGAELQQCVNYWSRGDIAAVVEKYKRYVIVNIANEAGDGSQSQTVFRNAYQAAVTQIRNAGVTVPLMIDAAGWGRNEEYIFTNAAALQTADPLHKLIFSWHPWDANAPNSRIQSAFDRAIANGIPFIVGEYAHKSVGCACCIPYLYIISYAQQKGIGWLAWEWGPGNSDCSEMDMTTDNMYSTLRLWGLQVAVTDPNSIQNTSVRPNIFGPPAETQPPTTPTALVSSAITNTSFNLSWTASTDNAGVTGYEVFRNGTSIGTPAGTSLAVTGLFAGTVYSMTVRARDAAGNWSAQSTALNVTTTGTASPNLALQQPVTASATESGFPATNAVDGNATTRWSTPFSDPQWIYVDLGVSRTINRVVLKWEAAYASGYQLQISENASNWTTINTVTNGDGGTDDINLSGTGRYIRFYGTTRGTTWGYSLFEFEIYGGTVAGDTQAPTVPAGLAASAITQTSFTLSWTASTDNTAVTGYEIFRNGNSIGTSTGTSFSVTGLTAATTYLLTVRARDAVPNWSAQSTALSVTSSGFSGSTKLSGTVIGTAGSWNNSGNTRDKVYDNNTSTYFDAPDANSGFAWAGLDLGSAYQISSIRYYPRVGNESRMNGGKLQASTSADFSAGVVDLYTISGTPPTAWTQQTVSNSNSYRYVRYLAPANSWGNVAEVEFYGTAGTGGDTQAPSVPSGLASVSITQASFTLSWTASTDNTAVTGYEIFRNGSLIGTSVTNNFAVTGLSAATTYSFTVRARDAVPNWSAQSNALSVTTSSGGTGGTANLNPVADTDTQSDVPAGTNPVVNASQYNYTFMKFNLASITGTVTSAKLRVYTNPSSTTTLNVYNASTDSWSEGTAKPSLGSLITSISMSAGAGYKEVDVTSRVATEATGDDLITFGLTTNLSTWLGFNTRENEANKPQLVVVYGGAGRSTDASAEEIISPSFTGNTTPRIFPNPLTAGILSVQLWTANTKKVSISLADAAGRTFTITEKTVHTGLHTIPINLKNNKAGLYFLVIRYGNEQQIEKLMIQQ